jgi:prepilin-type N-terminal cleavage/methylation domain-containing protein
MLFKLRFHHTPRTSSGFTIVEILITIVIIGILATISVVSYVGISNKANVTAIQSDLVTSYESLKIFQIQNSNYPTSITDCPTPAAGNLCIKPSGSNIIASYVKDNTISPKGFCINIVNGNDSYKITSITYKKPVPGDCIAPVY